MIALYEYMIDDFSCVCGDGRTVVWMDRCIAELEVTIHLQNKNGNSRGINGKKGGGEGSRQTNLQQATKITKTIMICSTSQPYITRQSTLTAN